MCPFAQVLDQHTTLIIMLKFRHSGIQENFPGNAQKARYLEKDVAKGCVKAIRSTSFQVAQEE